MNRQTGRIWETLVQAGVVEGEAPGAAKLESPWYVKVLLAICGWLAAVLLLGFIAVGFEFVLKNSTVALFVGGTMIGAAYALLHIPKNEFVEHLTLAVSLAGQALVVFAIFDMANKITLDEGISWLLVALLQVLLAIVMANFVHRVFSSFIAAFALSMALALGGWPDVVSPMVMSLAALCWLNEFRYPHQMGRIRAIGYGLVLALIQLKGTSLFDSKTMEWHLTGTRPEAWAGPWIGEVLIGAVALYVVWQLLHRHGQGISRRVSLAALLGAFLVCAVSVEVQGITVGVTILLLGFAGANRVLLGLGMVSLLGYISAYYYLLDATLLAKAQTLLIVGVVLLVLRWSMLTIIPLNKGGEACVE